MQYLILECAVRALLIAVCTGAVLLILRVKTARVRPDLLGEAALSEAELDRALRAAEHPEST